MKKQKKRDKNCQQVYEKILNNSNWKKTNKNTVSFITYVKWNSLNMQCLLQTPRLNTWCPNETIWVVKETYEKGLREGGQREWVLAAFCLIL